MALQIITGVIGDNMTYERIAELTTEDPADRVSLRAFFNDQKTAIDYFAEEKPVYGLSRIGMKFRCNHRGAS
jgi:hypothetical protein